MRPIPLLGLAALLSTAPLPAQEARELAADATPFILNGTTMVPMRPVFEWLGMTLTWDRETRRVQAIRAGDPPTDGSDGLEAITLHVGEAEATVTRNGRDRTQLMPQPPVIREARVFVPVRFVAQTAGVDVEWRPEQRRVLLRDEGRSAYIQTPPVPGGGPASLGPAEAQRVIGDRAAQVVSALEQHDAATLAALTHPEKGLRLSTDTYIDPDEDPLFTRDQLRGLTVDASRRLWGHEAGSGDPIELTFNEFWDKYLYDRPYAEAPQVVYNQDVSRGSTINNLREMYPGAITVEYHFPGDDPQYGGLDWDSLRMAFQRHEGIWSLVALAHDQWSP